jgi:DNA polymerase elongation subunit (family B)
MKLTAVLLLVLSLGLSGCIIVIEQAKEKKDAKMREQMDAMGDREGFAGAYVQEPEPGLYDWVYSLDLQSLYPSIIMSLNISPETKIGVISN